MVSVEEAKAMILLIAQEKQVSIGAAIKIAQTALQRAAEDTLLVAVAICGDTPKNAEKIIEQLPSRKNIEEAINQLRAEAN